MPLYEYQCDNGHRFEVIQKFSDPLVQVCPTCGSPVHKLMSSPAIQFKGTGWYVTDYARKGSSDTKETKSSTNGKESKDSKDSKETKTESTTTSESSSSTSTTTSSTSSTSSGSTSSGSKD